MQVAPQRPAALEQHMILEEALFNEACLMNIKFTFTGSNKRWAQFLGVGPRWWIHMHGPVLFRTLRKWQLLKKYRLFIFPWGHFGCLVINFNYFRITRREWHGYSHRKRDLYACVFSFSCGVRIISEWQSVSHRFSLSIGCVKSNFAAPPIDNHNRPKYNVIFFRNISSNFNSIKVGPIVRLNTWQGILTLCCGLAHLYMLSFFFFI